MNEESPLQITPSSSISLLKARSGLIARGLREAAMLPGRCPDEGTRVGICNKCRKRGDLALEGCVCECCSDVLDEQWEHSTATDWVLLTTPADDIDWLYPPSAVGLLNTIELMRKMQADDSKSQPAETSTPAAWGWPPIGLLSCVSPEAELFRPVGDLPVTKYVFRDMTFDQVKTYWARENQNGGLEIGGPEPSDLTELLSMASPWTDPAREDLPSLLRPATADEVALCEAILRDNQRREIVKRTLEQWGFDTKSIAVIAGITDPSKHQSCIEAWEELREQFGELGLLEGSVFEQEADLKAIFETKRSNMAPDEILERLRSIRVIRPRQSLSWYRKAAGSGDAQAQFVFGMIYAKGQQGPQNYAEAAKWYLRAAEQGNALAQANLGAMYYNGQGVLQDYMEAARWFRAAADQGIAQAQFNLGTMYRDGVGIQSDYAEAACWFRRSADQNHAQAQCDLGFAYCAGKGVTQDYAEAVKWWRRAAEQGNPQAEYYLGWACFNGRGITRDYSEAVPFFRKAAEQGHVQAQYELGGAYVTGTGVILDFAEGAKWYRKAAEEGHDDAQWNLGAAYYLGNGVPKNYAEAARWWRKAAELGNIHAQCDLGAAYRDGRGVVQNYGEAAEWFHKAAMKGQSHAQFNLGVMYTLGTGVVQDYIQAHMWINLAAAAVAGDDQKRFSSERDALAARMTPEQIGEAQKLAREWKLTWPG